MTPIFYLFYKMEGLKTTLKKIGFIFLACTFIIQNTFGLAFAYPGSSAGDFLFELGKRFYDQGNYQDALHEFEKTLLIDSSQKQALYYINLIGRKPQELPVPLKLPESLATLELKEELKLAQEEINRLNRQLEKEMSSRQIAVSQIQRLRAELEATEGLKLDLEKKLEALEGEKGVSGVFLEDKREAIEKALNKVERKLEVPVAKKPALIKEPEKPTYIKKAEVIPPAKIVPGVTPALKTEIISPTELEEPRGLIVSEPGLVKRKGEIGLFVGGVEVQTATPIIVKEGKVFLPLKDVAGNLYFSLLDLKEGNFKLISPEGKSQNIKASLIEGEPMITEQEVKDYFSVSAYFDASKKAFYILTKATPQFKTYTLEKPPEEIKKEKAQAQEVERILQASAPVERPAVIPAAARPSIQLRGNLSRTYIDYHTLPTYHSLSGNLTGRFYDFNLRYETQWKDINGVFDHDYTYLNLAKPGLFIGLFDQYLDLYPLRGQSQSFNGLKVIKEFGTWNKSIFMAGRTENTFSGTSGAVEYLGEIYGIKEEFEPLKWLSIKTALLYLENEACLAGLAGTTAFPRNNLVSFSDIGFKFPYDLSLSTQLARCYYEPDNYKDTAIEDWNWRVNTELNKKRYRLGLNYEFVGDQYASFGNPTSYQDYQGWNLYSNYRVTDNWSLSGSVLNYHNNVSDDPHKITQDNTAYSLSSYHRLTKEQSVNFSFSHFLSNPSGPACGASSKSNLARIDYFYPLIFDIRSILSYQFYRNDSLEESQQYYSHSPGISFFKSFGRGSSWYLGQQFTRDIYESSADDLYSNTSFNLNYVINPSLSLYLSSNYNRNKTDNSEVNDTVSGATGFKYQISRDTNLSCEYNINSYNLKTEKDKWPRNWSVMVYISQNFGFSSPPNFGIIEGIVFSDINANDRLDPNEPGIEGVTLYLEDKRETITGAQGYFRFANIVPGKQKVYLDLDSLSSNLTTKELNKEIDIRARRKEMVNFAIVEASLIKGKVFIDENFDSVYQDKEEPLENIALMLYPGAQFRRTDQDGNFKFDNLIPGKYKVLLIVTEVPLGYELVSKKEIDLEVSGGKEPKEVNFVVRLKAAPKSKF